MEQKEEKIELLKKSFLDEQKAFVSKIEDYSKNFRDLKKLIDLQILIFADREIILEKKSRLVMSKIKIDKQIREKKKKAFVNAKTNSDILLKSYNDINIYIDAELTGEMEKLELIEMQINFLIETIKTIDSVIFGIKNRIELERILNGD